VRPFIEGILAGRRASAGRVDEVVAQYRAVGGVSPYNAEARRFVAAVEVLSGVPAHLGMRCWSPRIADVYSSIGGVDRLIAVSLTPFGGAVGRDRNRTALEKVMAAQTSIPVSWVDGWHDCDGLVEAWAHRLRHEDAEHLVMTAHSVPVRAAGPYADRVRGLAERVASAVGRDPDRWSLAWQSRSGRPEDPWLGPDVRDRLTDLAGTGSVAVAPIGFVFDHVEILFDLGVQARRVAQDLGMDFRLVAAPGAHPALVADLAARIRAAFP
jgi:ferrochelatase